MNCFRSNDDGRRASKELEKKIKGWTKEYNNAIKILLLGTGESGKTTIIKQMKILHIEGFSESERLEKAKEIRGNILEALKELIEIKSLLRPPVNLEIPENEQNLLFIQNIASGSELTQEFFDKAAMLWADRGMQECFQRSHEFPVIDCAKYFLDRIDSVRLDNYIPSDQDILYCRKRTPEIQKIEFKMKIPKKFGGGFKAFWVFDVGGQRGERRKWIQVFDGITAVLFLVASSNFDTVIREDSTTNNLTESLKLFTTLWQSRFLMQTGFILFLNKQDLLEQKVKRGISIKNYFPDYFNYQFRKTDEGDRNDEYIKTRCFIRDKFMEITDQQLEDNQRRHDVYMANSQNRQCYWHFTIATDTNNIKTVFDNIHTMIIIWNLNSIVPV